MRKWIKAVIIFLSILLCTGLVSVRSFAASDPVYISVSFWSAGMWGMSYDFPYSDNYFKESSGIFSRDIAKASMGLMASAFRAGNQASFDDQYNTYLEGAGFSDIYAFGYDSPTSVDSLSGVIGHKKIGDFTLIAAAPCGQGYGKEWGGNLEMGTGERHEGFNKGAQIMERELKEYIQKYDLQGNIKLWLTGFSRAAAVGNLTAADMIEADLFEDVYFYGFGVPRTTKKPVKYSGMYNICGKFDPVTMVPLQSWGFERYGVDLYTPAYETDLNYDSYLERIELVTEDIARDLFRFNPELNAQAHLIIEFLGEMFPTSEDYANTMQENIMGVWKEANPDQLPQILISAFEQLENLDARQEYSSEIFVDYITYIMDIWMGDHPDSSEIRDNVWAKDQSLAPNLVREHMPYIYMSWIFSDLTDEELFGGGHDFRRLYIVGNVDALVWNDGKCISALSSSGSPVIPAEYAPKEEPDEYLYKSVFMSRNGEESRICLSNEEDFEIWILAKEPEEVICYDTICSVDKTYGLESNMRYYNVDPGKYKITCLAGQLASGMEVIEGSILNQSVSTMDYSPSLVMELESSSKEHMTLGSVVELLFYVLFGILVILLICLGIAIFHAIRKKKHGPYSPWYVIIPHYVFVILFVVLTHYTTLHLYLLTNARVGAAMVSMLVLVLLSLRGLIRNRNRTNLFILFGMVGMSVLNYFYQRSDFVSSKPLPFVIYCVIIAILMALAAYTFWTKGKKKTQADPKDSGPMLSAE